MHTQYSDDRHSIEKNTTSARGFWQFLLEPYTRFEDNLFKVKNFVS